MTAQSTGPVSAKSLIDAYLATLPQRALDDTSEIVFESGRFTYRVLNDWAKLPPEVVLPGVAAIATDKNDRVYVFSRGEYPVFVFERDGTFVNRWGKGIFANPHGIFVGPDGMVYCADDGDHTVRKCTPSGEVVMTLGKAHSPAPFMSGAPFCRCTDVALSPKGEIYVTDGYFNARVHKFSPDGKLISSFGAPGNAAGEFNVVHNIVCDDEGWLYVADRENSRVQVFNPDGTYETQWNCMMRPQAIDRSKNGEKLFYIGQSGPVGNNKHVPNLGPSLLILNDRGERLAKLGSLPAGHAPDRFLSCHGMCVDSRGDIYVGDNSLSQWRKTNPNEEPARLFPLRKLERVAG